MSDGIDYGGLCALSERSEEKCHGSEMSNFVLSVTWHSSRIIRGFELSGFTLFQLTGQMEYIYRNIHQDVSQQEIRSSEDDNDQRPLSGWEAYGAENDEA